MRIVDLGEEHLAAYFVCLEGWSQEMTEAGDHKARWYARMKDRGLRVKLALDDFEQPVGMIQYLPIEESFFEGEHLHAILCVWVHGHPGGIGNRQRHGLGTALLEAAEADARALGAKGMAAWGLRVPAWMRASWFKRHGYRRVDSEGLTALMFKPFAADAVPPRIMRRRRSPERHPGQVTVTACLNGWCPAQAIAFERAREVAAAEGPPVVFQPIDTCDLATMREWGIADGVFVDGRRVTHGPPPSKEKLVGRVRRAVQRIERSAGSGAGG